MLQATIATWQASPVNEILVVTHPDDAKLQRLVQELGVQAVVPKFVPREMKISIREGLRWLREHRSPAPTDAWMLAPADMPNFSVETVARLLDHHRHSPDAIVAPRHQGHRGHPVLFPWNLAADVELLSETEGVNVLLMRHRVEEVELADPSILEDVDTPEDYRRLRPETPT